MADADKLAGADLTSAPLRCRVNMYSSFYVAKRKTTKRD